MKNIDGVCICLGATLAQDTNTFFDDIFEKWNDTWSKLLSREKGELKHAQ